MLKRFFPFRLALSGLAGMLLGGNGFAPLPAQAADCDYTLQKDQGRFYPVSQLPQFVQQEIRPVLAPTSQPFYVHIIKICPAEKTQTITLQMDSLNYYILRINNQILPQDIVRYNNRIPLDISLKTFLEVVDLTPKYQFANPLPNPEQESYQQLEDGYNKQRILKMYAFVFAESARFEDVHRALTRAFEKSCQIPWHNFDALIHNWGDLSRFILAQNLLTSGQRVGGATRNLVAPITTDQAQRFVRALQAGQPLRFHPEIPFLYYNYQTCYPLSPE